jgi:hypothetical protein
MSLGTECILIGHLPQKPRCNPRMKLFVKAQLDYKLNAQFRTPVATHPVPMTGINISSISLYTYLHTVAQGLESRDSVA